MENSIRNGTSCMDQQYRKTLISTDLVMWVDDEYDLLYTGYVNDKMSQVVYTVTGKTIIMDRAGRSISLNDLRLGQKVRIVRANYQTFSIPPHTTAYHIQVV
ncbi:MAG TPA: hypothetical protein VHQ24_15320 [Lachnospiraceae bacterium]|nr:hypothetical protein [Lachnospiraceae bacterium]